MNQHASFFRLRFLVFSIFTLGALLVPLGGSAQEGTYFHLTSATRQCDDAVVNLSWEAYGSISRMTISLSNASSDWADQTTYSSAIPSSPHSLSFDHHKADIAVVDVVMSNGAAFRHTATITNCGTQGQLVGGEVDTQPDPSGIVISITNASCTGFNWSVESPYEVRAYASTHDILGRGVAPLQAENGTNLSGTVTYVLTDEEFQFQFSIMVSAYDLGTNERFTSRSLTLLCPIDPAVTPTPGVTPTRTPDPDATSDQRVIIQVVLPGGQSIAGAPWDLYAPVAAQQFVAEPYRSGVVGANNIIEIDGLIPGSYRLVVSPAGMAPIDIVFAVGTDPVTDLVLTLDEDGNATIAARQAVPVPTGTATSPATGDSAVPGSGTTVGSLPSTGSGQSQTAIPLLAFGLAAGMLSIAGLAIRREQQATR